MQLLAHQRERIATEQELRRRIILLDERHDCPGGARRIAELPPAVLLTSARGSARTTRRSREMLRGERAIDRPAQSVRKLPGATAVTAMPNACTSLPSTSEMPSSANLLPQ